MLSIRRPFSPPFRPRAASRGLPAQWLALWLAAVIVIVQLLGAAHHDHELAAKSQHCVSCVLHAQPHAAPPDAVPRIAPFGWILEHAVTATLIAAVPPAVSDYLLPLPHAPPLFPRRS